MAVNLKTHFEEFFSEIDIRGISPIDGGLTNTTFLVKTLNKSFTFRVPSEGTEKFISRSDEYVNENISCKLNISPKLYYFDKNTGFKINKFIKNAVTLNNELAAEYENIEKFVQKIKLLHKSEDKFAGTFDYKEKYLLYKSIGENSLEFMYGDEFLAVESACLQTISDFYKIDSENVCSHNDILAANLILDENNELFIIDYEYSSMNDKNWDLCSYITECALNEDEEKYLLNEYYGEISEIDLKKIKLLKIIQNFVWAMWAAAKYSLGDKSILDFGRQRFEQCKVQLKK